MAENLLGKEEYDKENAEYKKDSKHEDKKNGKPDYKPDYNEEAIKKHKELRGKLSIKTLMEIKNKDDLSIAYTPGVAAVSSLIAKNPELARDYTINGRFVAVISNGTAVLGLGSIGPLGALPVMEGKAALMKEFAGVDAFPLVINANTPEEIISFVKATAPTFAAINLEDIAAPDCFIVEEALQDIGIPVFHDDQHGTAIVVMAGLINAVKVLKKNMKELRVVVNGAGAAGTAITKLLSKKVNDIIVLDSKGIISKERNDLNDFKKELLSITNKQNITGGLSEALKGSDVFVGVSKPNLLSEEMIKTMNPEPIIFAMANPDPEITPEKALKAGAGIIATGRSDYPNQVNNVLAFPGIFKGAISVRAKRITEKMKIAAANALAEYVTNPTRDFILPNPLDKEVAVVVSKAVANAWEQEKY